MVMDWHQLPTLATKRLSLRPINATDVADFFRIYSDPEVMRYWSTPPLTDMDAASELISETHERFKQRELLKWAIALRTTDRMIGCVTIFRPDFTHRRAELGYILGRAQWRVGYMQEALSTLLDYAFAELQLHRLEADVDPRNAASIRTLERLGFQREGYLRERWQVSGELQDALFYGLLRPDWQRNATGGF
jgi:RimJ/RimL family protein N-acetyltransferase